MNVLFVGSTEGTACSLYYYNAMVRLGMRALPFDPRFFETQSPWERVTMRLRRAPSPSRVERIGERLLAVCRQNAFDAVFVMAENFIPLETIRALRRLPRPPRLLYHSHDNNYAKGILKPPEFFQGLSEFDRVYTTKSQNVDRYRRDGIKDVRFVPSAFEPMVHRNIPKAESRLGNHSLRAVFVGTYDHSRDAQLEGIGWDKLHVWGSRWTLYPHFSKHRDRIIPSPIYYFQLADVLSQAQVVLGLLREEAEDLHTQRTFEIPACRALQLAPRNDEIQSFFKEDQEIALFSSNEELRDKVDFYLSHQDAAKRIADAGHRRCLEGKHTYEDRVAEMLG